MYQIIFNHYIEVNQILLKLFLIYKLNTLFYVYTIYDNNNKIIFLACSVPTVL
jgi:hypothetical protein